MTKKKDRKSATVGFISLGCPKNVIDSERMLAEITQAGFPITADTDNADVVVINTCGFIAPARAEALETIRHSVVRKLKGAVKKVVVAGCLCERWGEKLFRETDGIDAIVGLGQRDAIARIIEKTLTADTQKAYLKHPCQVVNDDKVRLLITPRHWAYLRISEGCNHKCSFCTIPAIRGRFRSKPPESIVAEAEELAAAGVIELNIVAQDTTYYGHDLKLKKGLIVLLEKLEKIAALKWLRLMYLYPTAIDSRLIETIAKSEKIVHYFDIPVQHINNKILKDMYRPGTREQIYKLIENLRTALPDIMLRTTLIAGFPGETEQQFNKLLEFVRWAKFDALGCFKFYPEAGTPAAEMPGQIPEQIKQQRLNELMLTQQKITFAKNKSRIGSRLICIVDSTDGKGGGKGRFYGQAPDIDSICIIKNCSVPAGVFVDTKVVAAKDYDLIVEQI